MTHALRICNIYCFSTQHCLRKNIEMLRFMYCVSTVQCYVPLLCKSTGCSVYRAPSVKMCSSALILQSLAVTAVRFEMRYQFSRRALIAHCQYTCNTMCCSHVFMCTYCVHMLYTCIILFVLTATHIEEVNGEELLVQTYVRTLPSFRPRNDSLI